MIQQLPSPTPFHPSLSRGKHRLINIIIYTHGDGELSPIYRVFPP